MGLFRSWPLSLTTGEMPHPCGMVSGNRLSFVTILGGMGTREKAMQAANLGDRNQ